MHSHLHVAHRTHVDLPPLPPDERPAPHDLCRRALEETGHLDNCRVGDPANCMALLLQESGFDQ